MSRYSPILAGLLLACAVSLALNASGLRSFARGTLTVSELGAGLGSADEVYYFALIREVKDGFPNMGNSSLLEHRDAPSLTGYALLPQGLLAAATRLDLTMVVLIGDVLFPAIIAFLVFLIVFRRFGRLPEAVLFTLAYMAWWGFGWLRTMNPQVTMSAFFLSLLLFLSDRDCAYPWRRGLVLAAAVLVQPICALLLLLLEALDAVRARMQGRTMLSVIRGRAGVFLPPLLAGGLQSLWVTLHTDAAVLADLSARRGLTLSHLPSDPTTTILLLFFGFLWFLRSRKSRQTQDTPTLMMTLAVAGIIVLNQQVVHGHEAIFGLYYRLPLAFFLGLLAIELVRDTAPRPLLLAVLAASVLLYGSPFLQAFQSQWTTTSQASAEFRASGVPEVLAKLDQMPGEHRVLAPIEVSNFVPVLTHHYTLFTQYAHFEYVSDTELAERYLLIRRFFPLPAIETVEGDPLVFGLAAGNLYARARTVCRIENVLHLAARNCSELKLPDFIRHQDVRRFVDAGVINAQALLKKYHVDTVISDKTLPPPLASHCRKTADAGRYAIYGCDFAP